MIAADAPAKGKSALAETVRQIEEEIIFGRLRPRERLVEDDLIDRLGKSRHVIRQALDQLHSTGIVRRERNRGAVVREFSRREVEEIYEMRALLHRRACELIPMPPTREYLEHLSRLQQQHAKAAAEKDLRKVYYLNNEFHDVFFASTGNHLLAEAIRHYAWLAHAIRSYRMADEQMLAQAVQEHADMVDALARSDRDALTDLAVRHIEPSKEAYLQHLGPVVDMKDDSA